MDGNKLVDSLHSLVTPSGLHIPINSPMDDHIYDKTPHKESRLKRLLDKHIWGFSAFSFCFLLQFPSFSAGFIYNVVCSARTINLKTNSEGIYGEKVIRAAENFCENRNPPQRHCGNRNPKRAFCGNRKLSNRGSFCTGRVSCERALAGKQLQDNEN